MRIAISIIAWLAVLFGGGCAVFEKEMTNRGGYLDTILDEHWMKADSKGMRALRAFAMQVSLARIASVSAKNDSDRQLLAIRIGALTKRFSPVYACAFDTNPLGVAGGQNDPCFYYDSAMVDYSTGLFDLAMIALPLDDAKKLVSAVTGSAVNPINVADLLGTLLQIGKDAIKYGRVVGALYRDTIELEVQLWLATPAIDDRPPPYRVTEADVAPLRDIYSRRNDDMPSWIAAMAALRGQGLEPLPQRRFFAELGGLMRYICGLITKDGDAVSTCTKGLPTTVPAAASVLSGSTPMRLGGGVNTAGPASVVTARPASRTVAQPAGTPEVVVVTPKPTVPPKEPVPAPTPSGVNKIGDFEQTKMKPRDLTDVLAAICRPTDPDLGPAGSPSRKAMAAFLAANKRTSSEVVDKDVLADLRDLRLLGIKPAGCGT